jgi:UDPglucose 6-dehydrogenase
VAIDVPTNNKGQSNLEGITNTIETIKGSLNSNAALIILSQVPPGYTRGLDVDARRLFYQVETLIFGKAIERALYPERFIVGSFQKETALPAALFHYLKCFGCPIFQMTYESAELAKISINMYLTATVTTTNMLSDISEKVNANWEDIAETLKLDQRIGPYAYLKPGLGIAGGNLERDMATLKKIAFDQGAFIKTLDAQIEDSQFRANWALRKFKEYRNDTIFSIGVLGLAYKENTPSLKNSASLKFVNSIKDHFPLKLFDPLVKAIPKMHASSFEESSQAVVNKSNFLAILTPWPEFSELDYRKFEGIILDPYRLVKNASINAKIHTLGTHK